MIQVNGFLCHNIAMKTEGNCDEIGHATFSDATFSYKTKFCPLHVKIECPVTYVSVIRFWQ